MLQSADVTSIKKTLENGVCSNRAYSPGTGNGNGGILKSKTKTDNKHIIKSYKKGKPFKKFDAIQNDFAFHVRSPRSFTIMMASADHIIK